jgi:hypothetical protein
MLLQSKNIPTYIVVYHRRKWNYNSLSLSLSLSLSFYMYYNLWNINASLKMFAWWHIFLNHCQWCFVSIWINSLLCCIATFVLLIEKFPLYSLQIRIVHHQLLKSPHVITRALTIYFFYWLKLSVHVVPQIKIWLNSLLYERIVSAVIKNR